MPISGVCERRGGRVGGRGGGNGADNVIEGRG